ncbi:AbiU2 domain-containing protein [Paenibacillus sp. Marseille-Q9583]
MSTQYTKEDLLEFMEQLFKEIYHSNNKLNLHLYMHNKFVDNQGVSDIAISYFVITMDSLFNDMVIQVFKIFDKNGYGTIFKFLNLIEANPHLFTDKKIYKKAQADREKYENEKKESINIIRTWRNQLYAHYDKKYFLEKDRLKLAEDAPMLLQDIIDLLNMAVETINYYSGLLDFARFSLITPEITKDADKLFESLNFYIDHRTNNL